MVMTAEIIGHDADGANILHTPVASLKLYTTQPLPTGTRLVVEMQVESSAAPAATTTAEETQPRAPAPLPRQRAAAHWRKPRAGVMTGQPDAARDLRERLPAPPTTDQ